MGEADPECRSLGISPPDADENLILQTARLSAIHT